MSICEISIIIILICQKLGSVGPVQQKIKLPSPYELYCTFVLLSKHHIRYVVCSLLQPPCCSP